MSKFFREFFALRVTVIVEDFHVGWFWILAVVGLATWYARSGDCPRGGCQDG